MLNKLQLNEKTAITISLVFFLAVPFGCHAQSNNVARDRAVSSNADKAAEFDAARAYDHVKKLVALGPHPSGSESIKKAQEYIENELKSCGLKVSGDSFNGETPRGAVPMKNIIAELRGE